MYNNPATVLQAIAFLKEMNPPVMMRLLGIDAIHREMSFEVIAGDGTPIDGSRILAHLEKGSPEFRIQFETAMIKLRKLRFVFATTEDFNCFFDQFLPAIAAISDRTI